MKISISTLLLLLIFYSSIPVSAQWSQQGSDIDGEAMDDRSGESVALSSDGKTLAVGAFLNDGNGSDAGHVRVYTYSGSSWIQLGKDIDGEMAGDFSGISVSLAADGKTLAVGANRNRGRGTNSGHVRIFVWNGTAWNQLGGDIDGETVADESGWSVSLSADGTTLAIGAFLNDGNGTDAGHVRVFSWNGTSWIQLGSDIDGEAAGDRSGGSISLSSDGKILAIGAFLNDGNGTDAGHVRIYSLNGTAWTQLGMDIDGEAAGDYSGRSVSLSADGSIVAIGAYRNGGNGANAGHVRVFEWNGTAWSQIGPDIDGEAAGDFSGRSVSLSGDGKVLAIGAYLNAGLGTGAGHVRVYHWNGSSWVQTGLDLDGEASGDESGVSVGLSSDGKTLAIGARKNDGNGTDAGHVRVYSNPSVGIQRNLVSELLQISPNPSIGIFEIQFDSESYQSSKFEITDLRGRTILEKDVRSHLGSNNIILSIEDQPAGIYILKTILNGKPYSAKLIKF